MSDPIEAAKTRDLRAPKQEPPHKSDCICAACEDRHGLGFAGIHPPMTETPAAFSDAEILNWQQSVQDRIIFEGSDAISVAVTADWDDSKVYQAGTLRGAFCVAMRAAGLTPAATPERDTLIEQCAKIAEDAHEPCLIGQSWSDGWNDAAVHIAAKLRTLKGGSHAQ